MSDEKVWVLDRHSRPIDDGRLCRRKIGVREVCRRPAVMVLDRVNGEWAYCDQHTYGREVRENGCYFPVAPGSPAAERGYLW